MLQRCQLPHCQALPADRYRLGAVKLFILCNCNKAYNSLVLQAFPIKEDRLIELAKEFSNAKNGVANEDMIAPDFRFEFQVISLDRKVRCSLIIQQPRQLAPSLDF